MRRIRRHLSYANVISTLCLFLLLTGGTAVALTGANTVQSDDLGPGSQVTAPDVAANAVNGSDVVDNSLAGADLGPSSVGTSEVVNASLGGADIANTNSLTGPEINEATLSGVAHTSGPHGAIDILQEDVVTSSAYSASDPDTFVNLGHPFELRSPATANNAGSGFRLCNTSTAQFSVTVYIGGSIGSTSDIRSRPTLDGGTCTSIDYNGASTGADGDFRLHFTDGEVLFGTGLGIDSIGHIDILAIGGFD